MITRQEPGRARRSQSFGHGRTPSKRRKRPRPSAPSARCSRAVRALPRLELEPHQRRHHRLALIAIGIFLAGVATCSGPAARSATERSRGRGSCSVRSGYAVPGGARAGRRAGPDARAAAARARPMRTGALCLTAALTLALAAGTLGLGPGAPPRRAFWHAARVRVARRDPRPGGAVGRLAPALDARRRHPRRVPVRRRADPRHRRDAGGVARRGRVAGTTSATAARDGSLRGSPQPRDRPRRAATSRAAPAARARHGRARGPRDPRRGAADRDVRVDSNDGRRVLADETRRSRSTLGARRRARIARRTSRAHPPGPLPLERHRRPRLRLARPGVALPDALDRRGGQARHGRAGAGGARRCSRRSATSGSRRR